jgi:hypothetical protein
MEFVKKGDGKRYQKLKNEYRQPEESLNEEELQKAHRLEEILTQKIPEKKKTMAAVEICIHSCCKIELGFISYGIFWGIIYAMTTSYLKELDASGDLICFTWMMGSVVGFFAGWLFTIWLSTPQKSSTKRKRQLLTRMVSVSLLCISLMLFGIILYQLEYGFPVSSFITVIFFSVIMIAINTYMSATNSIIQSEISDIMYSRILTVLYAAGQIIPIVITATLDLEALSKAPIIFAMIFGLILVFMTLSLAFDDQYGLSCLLNIIQGSRRSYVGTTPEEPENIASCCQFFSNENHIVCKCCKAPADTESLSENFIESFGLIRTYMAEGTWIMFLFFMACWIALFAFLQWSVDWFVPTFYSPNVHSSEYNQDFSNALWIYGTQQACMIFYSLVMLCISELFEWLYVSDRVMCCKWWSSKEKLRWTITWCFTMIGLAIYSGSLFVAAFTDSKGWAYIAFVASGTGIAVIFPLNVFQNLTLNVKRKSINNETPYDKFWYTVSRNFRDSHYYAQFNMAVTSGQIIILLVTCFGLHFDNTSMFVAGSAASGAAIFLGMLMVAGLYSSKVYDDEKDMKRYHVRCTGITEDGESTQEAEDNVYIDFLGFSLIRSMIKFARLSQEVLSLMIRIM